MIHLSDKIEENLNKKNLRKKNTKSDKRKKNLLLGCHRRRRCLFIHCLSFAAWECGFIWMRFIRILMENAGKNNREQFSTTLRYVCGIRNFKFCHFTQRTTHIILQIGRIDAIVTNFFFLSFPFYTSKYGIYI